MNIIEYSQQKKHSIDCLNEVDALVLAELVYFSFELLYEQILELPIYLKDVNVELISNPLNNLQIENHNQLAKVLKDSSVFGQLKILDFQSEFSVEEETQFAAITYLVNEKQMMIAFRGTDLTVIGWKEDLNMSFAKDVLSQRLAVDYVNQIMSLYDYPTYVSGHSKGGNLAVYASAFCDKDYQLRIEKIYNFDGPGFHSEIIAQEAYQSVLQKVIKIIPRSSIVGLLLDSDEPVKIIESSNYLLLQHDPFTWKIKDNQFEYREQHSSLSIHFSNAVKNWLESIDVEQRKYLSNALFNGISALNITSFEDSSQFSLSKISAALNEYNNAEPEFKEFFKEIVWSFVKAFFVLK